MIRSSDGCARFSWHRAGMLGFVLTLLISSCGGYRVASRNRLESSVTTIAIVPFENQTTTFRVEQIITRALARGFVEKTAFQLVEDPGAADAVVTGAIDRVSANAVIFGRGSFGNTFLVTLVARLEMRDRAGKVLFSNNRFIFREQYVLNEDVDNFFSELNPALERLSRDFASSVIASILEDF